MISASEEAVSVWTPTGAPTTASKLEAVLLML